MSWQSIHICFLLWGIVFICLLGTTKEQGDLLSVAKDGKKRQDMPKCNLNFLGVLLLVKTMSLDSSKAVGRKMKRRKKQRQGSAVGDGALDGWKTQGILDKLPSSDPGHSFFVPSKDNPGSESVFKSILAAAGREFICHQFPNIYPATPVYMELMRYECCRFGSFREATEADLPPQTRFCLPLAAAGFFFDRRRRSVRCAWCRSVLLAAGHLPGCTFPEENVLFTFFPPPPEAAQPEDLALLNIHMRPPQANPMAAPNDVPGGQEDGPLPGVEDGPFLGIEDGPLPGIEDGSVPGVKDGPLLGVEDGPLLGVEDGSLPGVEDGPLPGGQGGPQRGGNPVQMATAQDTVFWPAYSGDSSQTLVASGGEPDVSGTMTSKQISEGSANLRPQSSRCYKCQGRTAEETTLPCGHRFSCHRQCVSTFHHCPMCHNA